MRMGASSMPLFRPFDIFGDDLIFQKFFQRIQLPAQIFFRKLPMDERMALPADINPAFNHFRASEMLFEPLVAVTGSWDQVMERG